MGFPGGSVIKNPPANAGDTGDEGSFPGLGKSPGRGHEPILEPTRVFLPGESHGWRKMTGYSPWGHKVLDITKHASMIS